MSKKKKKKTYWIPPDLQMNPITSSWFSGPFYPENDDAESPVMGSSFDIDMPIHPDYIKTLQPEIKVGDLVETHLGKVGIVVSEEVPTGVFITIKNANNKYYTVLINEEEQKYIGYSLKKIEKPLDKPN